MAGIQEYLDLIKNAIYGKDVRQAIHDGILQCYLDARGDYKVNRPLNSDRIPTDGTNGQLLRTKGDGSTEWVDVGLPTDEQTKTAITAWLNAHPEATTTVQDGAITDAKLATDLRDKLYKPFYDVTNYGIIPDTNDDLYDAIFDFLHDVVAPTGGIVYFPQGTYIISDTIFIPPNTIFMGSGSATKIKFTEEYASFGVGLSNGGSNVGIVNMTVDHSQDSEIETGSMTGSIGFSTRTFESWTTKHNSPSRHASCSNVFAEDLWTNTRYILQTEPHQNTQLGTITGVVYRNIRAKNSLISVMGWSANQISDVTIENVECAFLRIGTLAATNTANVRIINARAGRLFLIGDNVFISNSFLLPELKYDIITSFSGAVTVVGDITFNNCYIDASNYSTAISRTSAKLKMIGTIIKNSYEQVFKNADTVNLDKTDIIGCCFETNGTAGSEVSGRIVATYFPTMRYSSKSQSPILVRQRLESGDNLNDIKLAGGKYQCLANIVASIQNKPSEVTTAFLLDVDSQMSTDNTTSVEAWYIQKLTRINCTAIYMREWNGSTWTSWYKYAGTTVS